MLFLDTRFQEFLILILVCQKKFETRLDRHSLTSLLTYLLSTGKDFNATHDVRDTKQCLIILHNLCSRLQNIWCTYAELVFIGISTVHILHKKPKKKFYNMLQLF